MAISKTNRKKTLQDIESEARKKLENRNNIEQAILKKIKSAEELIKVEQNKIKSADAFASIDEYASKIIESKTKIKKAEAMIRASEEFLRDTKIPGNQTSKEDMNKSISEAVSVYEDIRKKDLQIARSLYEKLLAKLDEMHSNALRAGEVVRTVKQSYGDYNSMIEIDTEEFSNLATKIRKVSEYFE